MSAFASRLQSILASCVPCSFPKLNRLDSLTFDFHTPKLRISFNSIIPTNFWSQRHTCDPNKFRLTRSPLNQKSNKFFPKPLVSAQKILPSSQFRSSQHHFGALPLSIPETISFTTSLLYRLQKYSSIMSLYSCTSCTLLVNLLRSSRLFLSMSVQSLVNHCG